MRKQKAWERVREFIDVDLDVAATQYDACMSHDSIASVAADLQNGELIDITGTKPRPVIQLLNTAYGSLGEQAMSAAERERLVAIIGRLTTAAAFRSDPPQMEAATTDAIDATACSAAEAHFVYALQQVARDRRITHGSLSMYHNEDAEPILFRKESDEDTALTLIPMSMHGAVLPAGTIVTVDGDMDERLTGHRRAGGVETKSFLITDEAQINPIRPSAWVYDRPLDRATFAVKACFNQQKDDFMYVRYFDAKAALVQQVTIEHFVGAAQRVIERCQNSASAETTIAA